MPQVIFWFPTLRPHRNVSKEPIVEVKIVYQVSR